MSDQTWLVVGLGNPGPAYAATRHNAGTMVIELLAARTSSPGGSVKKLFKSPFKNHRRSRSDIVETRLGDPPGVRAVLARPRSYMNESGGPVAGLATFFAVPPERVVVIHDELDLPFGTLRIKRGGGDNGHNGLRAVRSALGTGDFCRVRFGVGRPPGRMDPAAFVLKPFSAAERKELDVEIDRAADAVEALVVDGLTYAQNHYNA